MQVNTKIALTAYLLSLMAFSKIGSMFVWQFFVLGRVGGLVFVLFF